MPLFIENLILYSDKPWKLTKVYKLVIEQGMEKKISIMITVFTSNKNWKNKMKNNAFSNNVKIEILEICLSSICKIFFPERYKYSVQLLSHVQLFVTPWTAARQASLSITNSQSLLKLMSIESVMPPNDLILCCPLLPLSIFPASGSFFFLILFYF